TEAGRRLAEDVLPLLGQLKMPHANMAWEFPPCEADALGMDDPEIWFTTNPGSPLLPLVKVASGG
ncbi:MAG: DNA repair protein RecN, partial [Bacteroidota bacterium]|nr:DNA repair protein RecN [Bacteroidota bacterium]